MQTVQLLWTESEKLAGVFETKEAAISWIKIGWPEHTFCYNDRKDRGFDVIHNTEGTIVAKFFIVGVIVQG